MAARWVIGDVHGCARELEALLALLALGADDELLSVGDLFHRGPDPIGVYELLRARPRFRMVLGNHERAMLRRLDASGAATPPRGELLCGDRGASIAPEFAARAAEILEWLRPAPSFLRGEGAVGGRPWILVHGSLIPGRPPEHTPESVLTGWHRLGPGEDAPAWVQAWRGPELAVFGHRRSASGAHHDEAGALIAFGTDTGCVYGGALTALRLEDGSVRSAPARR